MKKTLLIIAILFFSIASYAQTVSGTILNSSGGPMINQVLFLDTDTSSGYNSTLHGPGINMYTLTDASGSYSFSIPGSTLSGHPLRVTTADCWVNTTTIPAILTRSFIYSGTSVIRNFTTCMPPSINGKITFGTTAIPAAAAKVLLIKKNRAWVQIGSTSVLSWVLSAIDSTTTNANGNYSFYQFLWEKDSLLVKAFLPSTHANYSNYLPTYGTSSLLWSGAKCYDPASITSVTNNIALQAGINPGGAGFVGGSVLLGANKTTAVGDPVPGRQIILTDGADKPVAYTYSDNAGKFSFPALAYGSYKIFGDVAGKTSTPLSFTLSAANPSFTSIVFEEKALTFNAKASTGIANVTGQQYGIYPNPAKDAITIAGLTSDATVTIYDMTGRTLVQQAVSASNNTVNIAALATGNYVVKLATAQETTTTKLTKE